MKLLVGLGNPGSKYQETRHNIGFRFLDKLAQSEGVQCTASPRFRAEVGTWHASLGKVLLVKPQTFMNDSGEAVAPLARYYDVAPEDIWVVYDDLDLPSGKLRVKKGGGHGGHNGLRSLHQHLHSANYQRIRLGVGRPQHGQAVVDWVLGRADEGDRADEARVFDVLEPEIVSILSGQADSAANRMHLKLNPAPSNDKDSKKI